MKYVLAFAASEFVNFRQIEFESLCRLFNLQSNHRISQSNQTLWSQPYVCVDLKCDDDAILLSHRSILIKAVYQLWCCAPTITELLKKIACLPDEVTQEYLNQNNSSYKLIISSANKKISQAEKLKMIEDVLNAHTSITTPVQLQDPSHQLNLLLDYAPRNWIKGARSTEPQLRQVLYGRLLTTSGRKNLMNSYKLTDRVYLGNTSMDVRLAGLMANAGLCGNGSTIWDPFLGTGSIVLAASVWGAFGGGSDIDYALLHGIGKSPKAGQGKRGDGECLRGNYLQYGILSRYLDVMVADAATLHKLLRIPENAGLFDAILTDPPYGFRESIRRIAERPIEREPSLVTPERFVEITGSKLPRSSNSNDEASTMLVEVPHDLPHFPHKEIYPREQAYSDLLSLSARLLNANGRLVYWIAVNRDQATGPEFLPKHPRLELVAACEQTLNKHVSRIMVVMRKLHPTEDDSSELLNPDLYFPAERGLCCK